MEYSAAKDQSSATTAAARRSSSRLIRYPLRSANKPKEEKLPLADASNNSASKRESGASSVSKSVGVLDLSDKKRSTKPPRRLSVPSKSNTSPAPKFLGTITPISEAKVKRSAGHQDKNDTPLSDFSKSSHRRKFSTLSSASYWLSHIRLSESAAKHSISLGFFKLALEAGCEPVQRMSDELKSYIQRYNLSELADLVKELFDSYKISEIIEQSQGSQICSPVEGSGVCDEDNLNSSSASVTEAEKPKQNPSKVQNVRKANQETIQRKDNSVKTTRKPMPKNVGNSKSGTRGQIKPKKPSKQESAQDKNKVKQLDNTQADTFTTSTPVEDSLDENKENDMEYDAGEVAVA